MAILVKCQTGDTVVIQCGHSVWSYSGYSIKRSMMQLGCVRLDFRTHTTVCLTETIAIYLSGDSQLNSGRLKPGEMGDRGWREARVACP